MIQRGRAEGKAIKLLGRLTKDESGSVRVEVGPRAIDASHPLYTVSGTAKGVVFFTDTMGAVVVTGGKSERLGTAAAMLKDIINIYR
jgi:homoserine dehydrogenase